MATMGGDTVPELTNEQRSELGRYYRAHHGNETTVPTALLLSLVLAGDKPATCISPRSWEFPESVDVPVEGQFRSFIDVLDLHYRALGANGWIVSNARGRLDLLPSGTAVASTDGYDRRLGAVFGYPTDAIEFFIETDQIERVRPRERVENGEFTPGEIAYTAFVPYKHDTSPNGYKRAIEYGKGLRARCSELAASWNLPVLDTIAADYYQQAREKYSDSTDGAQTTVDLGGFTVPNPPRLDY